jgi:hypothetical protein
MKRAIALVLTVVLMAPACATSQAPRIQASPTPSTQLTPTDRQIMAEFARGLPAGSRVRATMAGSRTVRGTLMKATDTAIVVQPRARVPEPMIEMPFDQLVSLELEQTTSGSTGRTVGIAVAVGAGAALGVLLILAAIFAGD